MINVCVDCLKLNPLHLEKCHYCGGECQKVNTEKSKSYMVEFNQRKQNKGEKPIVSKDTEGKPCTMRLRLGTGQGGQKCR